MLLSPFTHRRQRRDSDCLVACAEMVLHHLSIQIDYVRLERILRVGPEYTPFGHLRYLERLGLSVLLDTQGDASIFETYIDLGLPVIAAVQTWNWAHWGGEITEHAVVVVGIDSAHDFIYINDPFFPDAPIEMSLVGFESGWEEKERQYAVIGLTPP